MKEPLWLTVEDALAAHEMVLAQHGGLAGVRDRGLLESALNKPLMKFNYGGATIAELAASYASGVILNHPFLDGNKRTGFLLAAGFLELNGYEFVAEEVSVVTQTLALAAGAIKEPAYAKWLAENSRRAK